MRPVTRLGGLAILSLASNSAFAQQVLREHLGITPNLRFGSKLCAFGDADRDGFDDYAVVTDNESSTSSPEIAAFSGRDGHLLWRYIHTGAGRFGTSVSAAGDIDRDGIADLWVGVPARFSPDPGAFELRRGSDGFLLRSTNTVIADSTGFGFRVAGLGDVNGDQIPDVAMLASRTGHLEVRSGGNGFMLGFANAPGGSFSDEFNSLANAGDCNGDGIDDFVYGNPFFSITGSGSRDGQIRIYSGRNAVLIRTLDSPRPSAMFGSAVCSLGDLDGDARSEIAIGSPDARDPVTNNMTGAAYVYSPERNAILYTLYPRTSASAAFGGDLNRIGDLDQDGRQDLAVSSSYEFGGGVVRVYSGPTGRRILEVFGSNSERIGSAIAPCGDINGDGRHEWLLGAAGFSGTLPFQGRALVMGGTLYATAEPIGRGCSFGGAPEPRIYVANRPALGSTIQLWNGTSSPAVILLGQETSTPYRIQFTDCYLYMDLGSVSVVGLLPASSAWPLGVPQETGLIGRSLVFQGIVPEPSGSFLCFVVTNGVVVRFGW